MRSRNHPQSRRRGVILVLVLVVIAVLALAAYTFSELMFTHRHASELTGRQMQCRALAESGVEMVKLYLIQDEASQMEAGGHYDNPAYFQGVSVLYDDDPNFRGNFTILAPYMDDEGNLGGLRYGLEDESMKLNVNVLVFADAFAENGGRTLLMALPGMTEEIADCILDWLDDDTEAREFGVESEYYESLEPAYAAKDGPLDTLEELLRVKGVTPQLLFGLDSNRNGLVDPHELNSNDGPGTMQLQSSGSDITGSMERGWTGYLTLFSMERNLDAEGFPRVFLNNESLEELYDQLTAAGLTDEWANFIVAYRLNGPYDGSDSGEPIDETPDLTGQPQHTFTQVLELIGAKTEGNNQVYASPFVEDPGEMLAYLPILMDKVTINNSPVIPGRININQAPRTLLMGIPGIDEDIVESIIESRVVDPAVDEDTLAARGHETWLLQEGIITLDQMKQFMPFINAGGSVYRAQVIGYFEDGGGSARSEVIIDGTGVVPRILSWKDISHLGRGYPLEILGVQLQSGF